PADRRGRDRRILRGNAEVKSPSYPLPEVSTFAAASGFVVGSHRLNAPARPRPFCFFVLFV
ncbi:MAG: hypothetical protein Q4D43_10220, partial [Clostridia bacterium]|nr:hypothetical protein [Clostridia bacterium]